MDPDPPIELGLNSYCGVFATLLILFARAGHYPPPKTNHCF
jgi:hypothetical protein